MKIQDMHNKTKDELSHILADSKSKLLKLSFDLAENKLKDVTQVKKIKKDIARIMTILKIQDFK